jgi:pimeloyl-ACP methyl ester carboxylesterase
LQKDLGFTPVFVRYNTGRHVSENGRLLAEMLETFAKQYPLPIEDLSLFGFSMGGLVLRSAGHYGEEAGHTWTKKVKRVFYLGTPHRGAPLAKFGQVLADALTSIDLPATRITGQILEGRSDGVKDLRHGGLVDEEWLEPHPVADRDEVPLPQARHFFFSASVSKDPDDPVGNLIGDLLVRRPSASGPEVSETHFSIDTQHYGGVMHHQLQNHPAVYEEIRKACGAS